MVCLPAVFLCLQTDPLHAEDKDKANSKNSAGSAPADPAQMMKQMEALAAPGPEHEMLATMAGEWSAETKCHMSGPDAPPTVSKGTTKAKMILGGRYLQEEFSGEMMGKKFEGISLTGYDKFNKKFVNIWIDNMSTGVFSSEGTYDKESKVLTMTGKMDDPMTGEKGKQMRLLTRVISPEKHIFEMHDVSLGEKSKVMEITYQRKAGGALSSTK